MGGGEVLCLKQLHDSQKYNRSSFLHYCIFLGCKAPVELLPFRQLCKAQESCFFGGVRGSNPKEIITTLFLNNLILKVLEVMKEE